MTILKSFLLHFAVSLLVTLSIIETLILSMSPSNKKMYNKRKNNGMNITYKEYCKISSEACNDMMDVYNIDKKYRLNPDEYK